MTLSRMELIDEVRRALHSYCPGSSASVLRNNHMNELREGEVVEQRHAEAVLVDFMNYFARQYGLDYGMYVEDLKKDPSKSQKS